MPDSNYYGTATLTFRAWDKSAGSVGSAADVSSNGGITAYSAASDIAAITVTAVNDAPAIASNDGLTLNEGATGNITASQLNASDVDDSDTDLTYTVTTIPANGTLFVDADDDDTLDGGEAITANGTLTQADINNGNLFYVHDGTDNLSDNFVFTLADGGEDDASAVTGQSFAFTVTNINDNPTFSGVPDDVSVTEDSASGLDLSAIELTDNDSGSLTLTLSINNGTFSTPADGASVGNGVNATLVSSNSITLVGSATDINTYLDTSSSIQYTGDSNVQGDNQAVISLSVNDGNGSGDVSLGSVNIDITNVNDAPTVNGLDGDTLNINVSTTNATVIDQSASASVTDIDSSDFNGATLTVSVASGGVAAEDVLAIANQGTGTGQISSDGSNVSYENTAIGSFVGGSSGNDLVVTFNSNATVTAISALLSAITYDNSADSDGTAGDRSVAFVLTDGDGGTASTATTTISVAVNQTPTLGVGDLAYTENAISVIDGEANANDVDGDTNWTTDASLKVQITANAESTDSLSVDTSGALSISAGTLSYNGSAIATISESTGEDDDGTVTGDTVLTFSFSADASNESVLALVRAIQYSSSSDNPTVSHATRTVTFTLADYLLATVTDTSTVTITPVNDAPQITETNASITTPEDSSGGSVTLNATDAEGNDLSWSVSDNASNGNATLLGSTFTYVPHTNFNGTDSFVALVSDGTASDTLTVSVTVTAVNDNPVISIDSTLTTDEDNNSTLSFSLSDVEDSELTLSVESQATNGTVSIDGSNVIYAPDADYNGSDSFVVSTTDSNSATVTQTITVTVNSVNDVPTISIDSTLTTDEDNNSTLSFSLSDVEDSELTLSVESQATNGTVSIDGSNVIYAPDADYNGSDSFVVSTTDSNSATVTQTITVTVNSVNDVPTISIDSTLTTDEDNNSTLSFSLSDVEDSELTLAVESQATNGTVSIDGSNVIYAPDADYNGSDSFVVSTTDSNSATVTQTITVTVNSVNDVPTISIDSTLTTDEDNNSTLSFSLSDVEDSELTLAVESQATNGTVSIDGSNVIYAPDADYNGSDSFVVSTTDSNSATVTQTITVTVNSVNDVPTISIDSTLTTDEDNNSTLSFSLSDVEDSELTLAVESQATNGTVSIDGSNVIYAPDADYNGSDSFVVSTTDSNSATVTQTITVTVNSVNDVPTISIDSTLTTDEDNNSTLSFSLSDVEDSELTLSVESQATNGTVSIDGSNVIYAPDADYNGSDSFVVSTTDSNSATVTQTITVTVNSVNDVPTISIDSTLTTDEDNNSTLSFSFIDVEGDNVAATQKTPPENGSITIDGRTITYIPEPNFSGTDSFVITLTENGAFIEDRTISVDVNPVNDAPVSTNDFVALNENSSSTFSVFDNDSDIETDTLALEIVAQPEFGTLTDNGDGTVTYTPNIGFDGVDRFEYQAVDDDDGKSEITIVSLRVDNTNDSPIINGTPATVVNTGNNYSFRPSASDADNDSLTFSIGNKPQWATFNTNSGELTGTPGTTDIGVFSNVQISVTDEAGITASLPSFSIEVFDSQLAPSATTQSLSTAEDSALALILVGTDPNGDSLTFLLDRPPVNGTLTGAAPNLIYTPNVDFNGADNFTFVVSDGQANSEPAQVNINVTSVNDAPEAIDDEFSITEGQTVSFDVLSNDTDIENDTLSLATVSTDRGVASIVDGQISYQAEANFVGNVSLIYSIFDSQGGSSTANVAVEIETAPSLVEPPIVTPPANITVNATALFTRVDIGIATAVDRFGNEVPVSLDGQPFFPPGINFAIWEAADANGAIGSARQQVNVRPIVSIEKDQTVLEGSQVSVEVLLNGESPVYPVEIPYTVNGTADISDHTLAEGSLMIESGTTGVLSFSIVDDGIPDEGETLVITLDDTLNLGTKFAHTITVVEDNMAPDAILTVTQAGLQTLTASQQNGLVTVELAITDANSGDTHTIDFSGSSRELVDESADESRFVFNPLLLDEGVYFVRVEVADQDQATDTADVPIRVVAELEVLDSGSDTDGDGIADAEEGYQDGDGDGIPDFMDSITECNVLPENADEEQAFLVEGDPGVCLQLGSYAMLSSRGGTEVEDSDLVIDELADNIGGVFDFVASGLPEAGQSYRIVFPQRNAIPANAVFRKFVSGSGWVDFVEESHNSIHSARGELGFCPPPGDSTEWTEGLTEGDWCIQLTIQDGGPNDDDGIANGEIVDPSGVAVAKSSNSFPLAVDDELIIETDQSMSVNVLLNDSDVDGDELVITSADADLGSVQIVGDELSYQPPSTAFIGNDRVVYSISDSKGGSANAVLSITVLDSNQLPVAKDDFATTDDMTPVQIDVLANDGDADGDGLTIIEAVSTSGSVQITDNQLMFTPTFEQIGTTRIEYQIEDSKGAVGGAFARVDVINSNSQPIALNDSAATDSTATIVIDVLTNDSDADGDTIAISGVSVSDGIAEVTSDNKIRYTPASSTSGDVTISYTIEDGRGGSASAQVVVRVTAIDRVAVSHSGGGSIGGYWLLLLAPIGFLRKNKTTMKKVTVKTAAALAMMGVCSSAVAETETHYTVRMNILWVNGSDGSAKALQQLKGVDSSAQISNYDDERVGWQLALGYQATPSITIEGGWLDLGEVSIDFEASVPDGETFTRDTLNIHPVSGEGGWLGASYRVEWDEELPIWLRMNVGLWFWEQEYEVELGNNQFQEVESSDTSLLCGFNVGYRIIDEIEVEAGVQFVNVSGIDDPVWSLGFGYRF